jgi:hypothetical protein
MSRMGPKGAWSGSNKPQSSFVGVLLLSDAPSISPGADLDFSFRLFFFDLPAGTSTGRRDETAALREATMSLAYCICPSLAPFSIGPSKMLIRLLIQLEL